MEIGSSFVIPDRAYSELSLESLGNRWWGMGDGFGEETVRAERLGERASERQYSKLGWRAAVFWSASDLAEPWIAPEREHVGAAGRTCSRARVIQSGRQRQHSKLGWRGGCVLGCFRLGGALDCVGAGTRESGWEGVFPSMRHPKRSQALATQTWVVGRWLWSALCLRAEL